MHINGIWIATYANNGHVLDIVRGTSWLLAGMFLGHGVYLELKVSNISGRSSQSNGAAKKKSQGHICSQPDPTSVDVLLGLTSSTERN